MEDLISVIVPIYNVEKYLSRCLESIINQTYSNIEIICINDGSKDNCKDILDEFIKKDKRIKIIKKENGGLSDARNKGIEIASGKYITFVDSDDVITNDYVEYLYNLIKKYDTKISICNREIVWESYEKSKEKIEKENGFKEEKLTAEQAFRNMLLDQGIDICAYAKMYERSLWKEIRYPVGTVYEDSATTYKLLDSTDFIAYGTKKCYFYIARPGSISKHKGFDEREFDYINNTNMMLEYIGNKYSNLEIELKRYYVYSKFRIYRMLLYTNPRNKELEKICREEINKYKYEVLKFKETPRRDKLAIRMLSIGREFFKFTWSIYCKLTNRI